MNVEIWDKKENRCIHIDNVHYIYNYTTYIKLTKYNGTETIYKTNEYALEYIEGEKCQK
ncbi:unnamed protein product [marine sediment metagenome]|uniref:Uncharacterized protein n=1 Tax=marine sediment metagenome TaxID=412755 RepID=X1APD9_9ZZZZ